MIRRRVIQAEHDVVSVGGDPLLCRGLVRGLHRRRGRAISAGCAAMRTAHRGEDEPHRHPGRHAHPSAPHAPATAPPQRSSTLARPSRNVHATPTAGAPNAQTSPTSPLPKCSTYGPDRLDAQGTNAALLQHSAARLSGAATGLLGPTDCAAESRPVFSWRRRHDAVTRRPERAGAYRGRGDLPPRLAAQGRFAIAAADVHCYRPSVRSRDQRLLAGLALTALVWAVGAHLAGDGQGLLYLVPLFLLLAPLLLGRYVGEAGIARIAARPAPRRRRVAAVAAPRSGPLRALTPRGRRLLAFSLAVRPPPVARAVI